MTGTFCPMKLQVNAVLTVLPWGSSDEQVWSKRLVVSFIPHGENKVLREGNRKDPTFSMGMVWVSPFLPLRHYRLLGKYFLWWSAIPEVGRMWEGWNSDSDSEDWHLIIPFTSIGWLCSPVGKNICVYIHTRVHSVLQVVDSHLDCMLCVFFRYQKYTLLEVWECVLSVAVFEVLHKHCSIKNLLPWLMLGTNLHCNITDIAI